MTIAQSLFKNTLSRVVTEMFNRFGAAIFWVLVARYLGVSALGVLVFGLSLHSFFLTISCLGLGSVIIRDVARDLSKAGLYLGQSILLGSMLSILAAIVLIGFVLLSDFSGETILVCSILAITLLPASVFYWSKSLLSAVEQMHKIAFARLIENMIKVLVGIVALLLGGDILVLALVLFTSKIVSAIVVYVLACQVAKPVWRIDTALLRYFVRLTPQFGLTAITNSLFWTAPVIILARIAGDYQAGLFAAAYKLVDMMIAISLAYGQAFFPVASRSLNSRDGLIPLVKRSIKYSLMFSLAITVGMIMLARPLVQLVYGTSMLESLPVLRLLACMILPFSMVPVLAYSLVSHHLQKYDLLANALAAAAVILLAIVLVPSLGAVGAAYAVLTGTVLFWLVEWISVQQKVGSFSQHLSIWKPVLAALVMAAVLHLFREAHLILIIILAGTAYILVLILSKSMTRNEFLKIMKKPVRV